MTCFTSRGRRSRRSNERFVPVDFSWAELDFLAQQYRSGGAISLHPDVGKTNYGCSTHVHHTRMAEISVLVVLQMMDVACSRDA